MNRKKELLYNIIVIGVGNIFSKAISFFMVPLFTIWLTTEEYGLYDIINSYVSLLTPLVTLQIEQAIMRYCIETPEKNESYLWHAVVLISVNSILVSGIIFLTGWEHSLAFALNIITYSYYLCISEWIRGKKDLVSYSKGNIISAISALIYSAAVAISVGASADNLLFAFSLSYITAAFYLFKSNWKFLKGHKRKISIKVYKMLLSYSIPLLPNAISWWVTNVSDRTVISIFLGNEFNGIYAVSCKIPTLIAVFFGVFNLAWQQSAISSCNDAVDSRKKFYYDTISVLLRFLFSGACVIVAFTPILYRMGIESSYQPGMKLVPILLLGSIFLNMAQYCGGILLAQNATKINGITAVVAAIINVVVNLVFINRIGLYAAAISTLFSYIVLFGLRLFNLRGLLESSVVLKEVVEGGLIFLIYAIFSVIFKSVFANLVLVFTAIILFLIANKQMILKIFFLAKDKL